ncbi:hypothetical protein Vadar_001278 [Vaccinium darrowii]|nr:hypothetical protein Vadar_001278 [Vaccinium darrowii]
MIKTPKLSFMGVVEAKLRFDAVAHTVKHCFPTQWAVLHNAVPGGAARIVVAWDTQVLTVDLILSTSQLMVFKVLSADQTLFFISYVYGHNSMVERRSLWNDMQSVSFVIGDTPWLQMGDFNVVRRLSERLDGFDSNAALEFNTCLHDIGMDDMPFKGLLFTWSNKRGGVGDIKSKLDRVLINGSWMDSFPEAETIFLAPGVSDHSCILVNVLPDCPRKKPFKFFGFWMKHEKFKEEVQKSWMLPINGPIWSRLDGKLKRLKPVLRSFNKKFYSQISERVIQAREELGQVQLQCAQDPSNTTLVDTKKVLYLKFVDLSLAEEAFKKQKSRVQWLSLGDQNTRFFNLKMKSHCLRNKILSLNNAAGVRLTDSSSIKDEILGYYIGLLGSPFAQRKNAYQALRLAVPHRLSTEMKGSGTVQL